jgi:hypothetical protein
MVQCEMSENSSLVFHAFALITNTPGDTPGFKTFDLYDLNVMKRTIFSFKLM